MSQFERLTYIDSRIRNRGGVTLREVAEAFEVSERQARRDIEYLQDRCGAPISWMPEARRYEYVDAWGGLEFADERALLFLVFARAASGTVAYVPLPEKDALEGLSKLAPSRLRSAEKAIRYELPGFELPDGEALGLIVNALAEGRCLDIAYRDAEGVESRRRLEPERLINYDGAWYFVAYDQAKRALRTFRLSRIERLSLSDDMAARSVGEAEVDAFLDSPFGMFKGSGDKRATLRFYGPAAAVVRDETWHPRQERSEGRDPERGPYVELSVPVSQWAEILGRVLRFGSNAEPLAPPELRELWEAEIRKMAQAISRDDHD